MRSLFVTSICAIVWLSGCGGDTTGAGDATGGTSGGGGSAGQAGSGANGGASGTGGTAGLAGSGGSAGTGGQPATLETFYQGTGAPHRIAVGSGFVVWTERGGHGNVMKAELPDGTPEVLADGQSYPSAITIVGQAAIWRADGGIKSAPLTGGPVTVLVTNASGDGLAEDDQTLVWGSGSSVEPGVFSAPLSGGEAKNLVGDAAPNGIDTGGGLVFWADLTQNAIRSVPLTGGTVEDVAKLEGIPGDVVVSGDHVFWEVWTGKDAGVWRAPLAGGTAEQVVSENDYVCSLAVVDDTVYYYHQWHVATIRQVPTTGGNPVEVLEIPDVTKRAPDELGQMAADATHVYWIDGDNDAVYRVAR